MTDAKRKKELSGAKNRTKKEREGDGTSRDVTLVQNKWMVKGNR